MSASDLQIASTGATEQKLSAPVRQAHGTRWSPTTRDAVRQALIAGLAHKDIAAKYGVSRVTIGRERVRMGLPPVSGRWGDKPHVIRGPSAARRRLEPLFHELYAGGHGDPEIAAAAGCKKGIVYLWRRAACLPAVGKSGRRAGPPRAPKKRQAKPIFVPISPATDPLYAAALSTARSIDVRICEDLASEIVVAVLSGVAPSPNVAVGLSLMRRCRPIGLRSLDAGIVEGSRRPIHEIVADREAEMAFRIIELRHLAHLMGASA